jgi:spermidine/putrescine transport system substrate-binding protein
MLTAYALQGQLMKWIITTISLLLGLLLSACADASKLSLQPASPPTSAAKPAPILNIYSQEPAFDPATLTNFETRFGVAVNYETAASRETGLADLQAGLADYDLVILSDTIVGALRAEGIFAPLNKDNIPNFKYLEPKLVNPIFDPGNRYCVAYQEGTMGLGYNLATVDHEVEGWADVFRASPPLRLGLPADNRLALAAALLYLGYSPNTTNADELNEAAKLMQAHAGQFVTYAPGRGSELLTNGQVDLLFARSGIILQRLAADPTLRYTIPSEGSLLWIDNLCLPANAAQPELAENFINYILEPQVSAALANFTYNGTTNQAALALLKPADRANPALYPDNTLRQRLFAVVNVDPATSQRYDQAWAELVADPLFQAPFKSN